MNIDRRQLTIHEDNRGSVRETFRASWVPEMPPIRQLVRSESKPRTLRGMHVHRKQWDVWHFASGSAIVRVRDEAVDRFIHADPGATIAIPPGVAHGFLTWEGCILIYGLTEEFDGSDEDGWYPFDGLAADAPWPKVLGSLIISERDLTARRLT